MDGIRRVFETIIPKKLRIEDNFERHAKESTCNVGDPGSIPGSGRSPGEGNGNSFQLLLFLRGKYHGQRIPGRLQSMGSQGSAQLSD